MEKNALQVGFGRREITPSFPAPLAGYGNNQYRYHTNVLHPIYVSALAFTDAAGETAVVCSLDLLHISETLVAQTRKVVHEETGLAPERILFCATHTHAAPDTMEESVESVARFRAFFTQQALQAVKDALADRAPADIRIGRTKAERMNFVRRYVLNDGDWLTGNYNSHRKADIVGHESEADPEMQVMKIVRPDRPAIRLCNWQAHPTITGGINKTDISADFIAPFRANVEQATGDHFVYFTGGAGNLSPNSHIPGENSTDDFAEYCAILADTYLSVRDEDLTPVTADRVQFKTYALQAEIDHRRDDQLPKAMEVIKIFRETGSRPEAMKLGSQYGFHSVYHANSVRINHDLPQFVPFELDALRLGDIAFATAPFEMFDTNARQIKDGAPGKMTFVCSCANGYNSYLPSLLAADHKGYENDVTRFLPGTADLVAQQLITMLTE